MGWGNSAVSNPTINPFSSKQGLDAISNTESYWAYIARIGRWKCATIDGNAIAVTGGQYLGGSTATPGYIFIPKYVTVSSDTAGELQIQVSSGYSPTVTISDYYAAYKGIGADFTIYFDGQVWTDGDLGGKVQIGGNFAATGAKIYGTVAGFEVTKQYA